MSTAAEILAPVAPPHDQGPESWRLYLVEPTRSPRVATVAEIGALLLAEWRREGRPGAGCLASALRHQIEPAFGGLPVAELQVRYLREALELALAWATEAYGREPGPGDLVCPSRPWPSRGPRKERQSARPWNSKTALRAWHADLATLGIPHPPAGPRTLRCTRHTFATLARRAGADAHAVHWITHASAPDSRTSVRVYTHLDFASLHSAVERFDASLLAADPRRGPHGNHPNP